jgi:hypothetical protein
LTVLIVLLTVVVPVLCVLVAGLLRAYATLLARLHQTGRLPRSRCRSWRRHWHCHKKASASPFRTADGVMPLDRGDTGRSAPRQTAATGGMGCGT